MSQHDEETFHSNIPRELREAQEALLHELRKGSGLRVAFDGRGLERPGYNVYVPNVDEPVLCVHAEGEVRANAGALRRAGREILADHFASSLTWVFENADYPKRKDPPGRRRLDEVSVRGIRVLVEDVARETDVIWDIRREGRAWGKEAMARYELTPEKIEMDRGKLFWSDKERLRMLALLLENVGADQAVRLGRPEVWREAVAKLPT